MAGIVHEQPQASQLKVFPQRNINFSIDSRRVVLSLIRCKCLGVWGPLRLEDCGLNCHLSLLLVGSACLKSSDSVMIRFTISGIGRLIDGYWSGDSSLSVNWMERSCSV
jgi:hypothetical protein